MEVHVYLHKNGGFPNIFNNAYPTFFGVDVAISNEEDDKIIAEFKKSEVFRIEILMEK